MEEVADDSCEGAHLLVAMRAHEITLQGGGCEGALGHPVFQAFEQVWIRVEHPAEEDDLRRVEDTDDDPDPGCKVVDRLFEDG